MSIKVVNVKDISHEEWLEYRRHGLGGSDAAAVMGLNPFRSRLELYSDKLGRIPEKEDTEAMRVGRDLEQYVADRFCEATGKKVRRNNFMWRHDEHEFMLADVDREIIGENAGLECKTTSVWNKSDFRKGEIPLVYYVQCVHYMAVRGYDRMYLAVLILGKGFYWFVIERNEREIEALITSESSFWYDNVLKGIPPSADGSKSAETAVNALWGTECDEEEIFLHDMADTIKEYAAALVQIKQMQKYADSLKQSIQLVMQDHGRGSSDEYSVTWLPQSRKTVDADKLRENYPEAYNACTKTSTARIFKIKEIKKDEYND